MGKNESKKIYDGILVIFRDAEQIEKFIGLTKPTAIGQDDLFRGGI